MPRKLFAPGPSVSSFALLCVLLLCLAATACGDSCISGVFNPPNSMFQVNTCSLKTSNGMVQVNVHGSGPAAQTGSFSFRHIYVTISGVEVSSEVPPRWREIAPALESQPLQLDLLEGSTASNDFGRVSLGEASIPTGDYTDIRLRLAAQSTSFDAAPESNQCRDVGINCAVAWDGAIRPLMLGLSAPEIRIAPAQITGGFLRVLPDAATRLDIVFNAASSRAELTAGSVHLTPVFEAESRRACSAVAQSEAGC